MSKREKLGDIVIHKGDPRITEGVETLDDVYQTCLKETQAARKRTYLWGSDAGVCPRKNLYNQECPVPFHYYPSTKGYMAYGVSMENLLARALQDHNRLIKQDIRLVEIESELIPNIRISGKMDIIALDHNCKPALIECKTCGPLPSKPKVNHLKQLLIYAAVSGFNNCYVTYVSRKVSTGGSRGKLDLVSFPIEITKEKLYSVLYTACLSQCCMNEKKAVPVPSGYRKSHECAWCDFSDYCWPYDETPVSLFSRKELDRVRHLSMNAASEILDSREHRYTLTLEKLLMDCDYDELKEELNEKEKRFKIS
jgi:hypothetical protein